MAMDLRDYFLLRCSDTLVMERDIWQMNNLMTREVEDLRLKEILQRNSIPTRQQISNLEQVVDGLGGFAGPEENPVTQGMIRAHRLFIELIPPQYLIDIHDALEATKIENMEIAAYNGLINLARLLGEDVFVPMLQQNLAWEERMRKREESELPSLLEDLTGKHRRKAA